MTGKALVGVRVVELAQMVAGPYCAKLLADLGAETIKVEKPGSGDESRERGPFPDDIPHPEKSGLFLYINTSKLGVTLELAKPEGRRLFHQLLAQAQVFICDRTERQLASLGLHYQELRQTNPHLIITSLTPFGLTGPYRDFKSYYLNNYHASGLGYLTPLSQDLKREPVKIGGFTGEYACGVSAALATTAALLWQRATGKGQLIDISQQEVLLSFDRPQAVRYPNEGTNPTRKDLPFGTGGLMPCRDGFVMAVFMDDRQWKSLVQLMGNPAWADGRYEEAIYRFSHYDEIESHIEAWMREHTIEEIYHPGQALGLPVSPVLSPADMVSYIQFQVRSFFVTQEHPLAGQLTFPGTPFRFSQSPWALSSPAPTLGQHNHKVYSQLLGLTQAEIEELHHQEAI